MLPSASLGRHITLAPGLAVAIYGGKPFAQTAPLARPDLDALSQDAAPGDLIVMAHTDPDPTDLSPLRELLRAGFRTWLGVPSNQLAALALARGVEAEAERAACEGWWILTGELPADLGAVDITRHGYALDDGNADLTRDLLEQAATSVRAWVISTDVGLAVLAWVMANASDAQVGAVLP